MLAIFKRDFKSLFTNVIGWIFIGVNLMVYGLYFFANNLYQGYPSIAYTLSAISFFLVFTVPILTMRAFTEERKNKTDQLLFTAPVSIIKIIIGKFLALVAAFAIVCGVIALSPLVLRIFGDISFAENYTALFGYFLFGCACIAVGLFISAITESQIVSILVSVFLLFLGFMMASITGFIFQSDNVVNNVITTILNSYDLATYFDNYTNGLFTLKGILYFLLLIAFNIFLTYLVIQKRRWVMTKKVLGRTITKSAMLVIAIAALVLGNLGISKLPTKYTEFDSSSVGLYKLTDETKAFFKDFDEEATIYVLVKKSECDDTLCKTLDGISSYKNIKIEYVNPDKNPNFYAKYTDTEPSTGSLIVVSGKKSYVIDYNDIYDYSIDYSTYSQTVSGYDAEGQIVSALQYVVSDDFPTIYTLTGHNETELGDNFTTVLKKCNYVTEELSLITKGEVPADCDMLIINGPASDINSDELDAIEDYLANGGNIMLAINYEGIDEEANYKTLLKSLGVSTVKGVVSELDTTSIYQSRPYFVLPTVEYTEYTDGVNYVFTPTVVALTYTSSDDFEYVDLLTTSDKSFSKADIQGDFSVQDASDKEGPFTVGLEAQTTSGGRAYVFGSCDMFTDDYDTVVSKGNSTLFGNIVSTALANEQTGSTVYIESKSLSSEVLYVSTKAKIIYGLLWGIFLPIISIVVGIVIWAVRRKK